MADTQDRPHDPLDEYFDRLDKAFATLSASPRARPAEPSEELAGGPQVTDALVDALTSRIIERLGPDAVHTVRAIVVQVVSEVAERLVREEIDRARNTHHV